MSDYGFIEHEQDPTDGPGPQIARANVGATGAKSEAKPWLRWAVLGSVLLAVTIVYLSTRGPSFDVRANADGSNTLVMKSQQWQTELPKGWSAGRGGDGIILFPAKHGSAENAMKQKEFIKVLWGDGTSATQDFADEITKAEKASAKKTLLRVGSGTRSAGAVRLDDVNGGTAVYIDHDPSLAISTMKVSKEFEAIIENILFV